MTTKATRVGWKKDLGKLSSVRPKKILQGPGKLIRRYSIDTSSSLASPQLCENTKMSSSATSHHFKSINSI